jgi:hypothetical protein
VVNRRLRTREVDLCAGNSCTVTKLVVKANDPLEEGARNADPPHLSQMGITIAAAGEATYRAATRTPQHVGQDCRMLATQTKPPELDDGFALRVFSHVCEQFGSD